MMRKQMLLETERLLLRPFQLTDVKAFARICADPEVMKYIGGGAHDMVTTEKWIK